MDLYILLDFFKKNPQWGIFALSTFTVFLSYFLAIKEFYVKKARYDFFIIDDMFRAPMRSGVHPEYLLFSGVIMGIVAFVVFSGLFTFIIKWIASSYPVLKIIFATFLVLLFGVCTNFLIRYFFLRPQLKFEHCWTKKELIQYVFKLSVVKGIEASGVSLIFLLTIVFVKNNKLELLVLSAVLFIAVTFTIDYIYEQKCLEQSCKFFQILVLDRQTYAILENDHNYFYTVKCELRNNKKTNRKNYYDSICLYLNKKRIISITETNYEKKYFYKICRFI